MIRRANCPTPKEATMPLSITTIVAIIVALWGIPCFATVLMTGLMSR
jgi:hypothetical protein